MATPVRCIYCYDNITAVNGKWSARGKTTCAKAPDRKHARQRVINVPKKRRR